MRPTVLVVDDRERPRRALALELEDAGFSVLQASDGEEAWGVFQQHEPDAVVTDMVMPRSDGLHLLSRIRARSEVPVILFTAHGTVQAAATAFKSGADDFVSSPDVDIDDLVGLVKNAVRTARTQSPTDLEARLIGRSRAVSRLRERVAAVAPLRTPVLVSGEPGSGRDTIVHLIHERGASPDGKLIRIDAGSFDPTQESGDAAAIYLDGIENLSEKGRSHWLEWLAAAELAGFTGRPRMLASTGALVAHRLREDGDYDELRNDLVRFTIELPPLRALAEDLPDIADGMVARLGARIGRKTRLSPAAREFLAAQRWPGNYRQMEEVLERAIAFTRGRQISRQLLKELLAEMEGSLSRIREQRDALERDALLRALQRTRGNVTHAAESLGKSRAAVYRLIAKHGIALGRDR